MNALRIEASDFYELEDFSFAWRFDGSSHGAWPLERRAGVRPIRSHQAAEIARQLGHYDAQHGLRVDLFRALERFRGNQEITSAWLRSRVPGGDTEPIVVSWTVEAAVLTTFGLFASHWDDFCYPASDDVLIAGLEVTWVLRYFHEDEFQLGLEPARSVEGTP